MWIYRMKRRESIGDPTVVRGTESFDFLLLNPVDSVGER